MGLFLEQWNYGLKAERDGRGVYHEADTGEGGFCEEAFDVKTLRKVDVSIGAFPAYSYVLKGSEEMLDSVYGNWRSKLDKAAYGPGQGKPGSWSGADLIAVCRAAFGAGA
jgi:hypothetical protein